jgi:hypothetical protein
MEMKDSGERQQFEGGAQRDTATGKPKMGLLSPYAHKLCVRATVEGSLPIDMRAELHILDWNITTYVLSKNCIYLQEAFEMLLTWYGFGRLCDWLEKGSIKYSAFNWAKGMPFSRVMDSYLRHRVRILDNDEDHPAAMMCNLMFLWHYEHAIRDGLLPEKWNDLFSFPSLAPVEKEESTECSSK